MFNGLIGQRLATPPPSNPITRRLINGALANLLGKVWVLLVQLAAIPILTAKWGVEGYGVWLMLTTIPTYIALSDVGLGTAAGVEITARLARGDVLGALEAFQSVWVFLTCAVAALALITVGYSLIILYAFESAPGNRFGGASLSISILAITLYAVVAVQMSALAVVFRATHKYALGTLLLDLMIPLEGATVIIIAWSGGGMAEAATAMLVLRLPAWFVYHRILRRRETWFHLGWNSARLKSVRRLLNPSIAAFALTLANALILQGAVLVLGWAAGAASVAVFGAARLMSRVPLQFAGLVTRASIPELTRAQVAGNRPLTRRLLLINVSSALAVTIPFAIALAVVGPALLAALSGGRLEASHPLFFLLALAAVLNAGWTALGSPLVANNEHWRFAYAYLGLACLVILTPFAYPFEMLVAVAAGMSIADGTILALVLAHVSRLRDPTSAR